MTIYTVADTMTGLVESVMMIMLCDAFCNRKENFKSWVYIADIFVATALITLSNNIFKYSYLNVVFMIIILFAMTFAYEGKITHKAIVAVIDFAILTIMETVTVFTVAAILSIPIAQATDNPQYRLLGIIISKAASLILANAIRLKYKKSTVYRSASYWLLFFMSFFTSTTTGFLLFNFAYNLNKTSLYVYAAICSLGMLISSFFSVYLYEHLSIQAETIRNQQQYEQHLKMQLKHFDEMLVAQKQLKKFKHDFKNYVIGLQAYIDENNVPGANDYLEGMKEKFAPGISLIETGNPALDAMLSTKKAVAQSREIDVYTQIQIPENLPIEPIDLCVIFGNALDNAIEGCERAQSSNKKINIEMRYRGETLFCRISNTAPKPENYVLKTSKPDKKNHGFGLENIKTALAKYNSSPIVEYSDNTFVLKFTFFLNTL